MAGVWPGSAADLIHPASPYFKTDALAGYYVQYGKMLGLRADILWAMARVETGEFRFGGQVKPEQNNFCGLRKRDGSGFYSFDSPVSGVIAHVAHLAWHVFPNHVGPYCSLAYDPKHGEHPNDMKVVRDLTIWAGGSTTYAPGVVRRCNE